MMAKELCPMAKELCPRVIMPGTVPTVVPLQTSGMSHSPRTISFSAKQSDDGNLLFLHYLLNTLLWLALSLRAFHRAGPDFLCHPPPVSNVMESLLEHPLSRSPRLAPRRSGRRASMPALPRTTATDATDEPARHVSPAVTAATGSGQMEKAILRNPPPLSAPSPAQPQLA